MKRTLPALAILITILLNGCEKDQSILLNEKTLIKSEKGLLCRGCGQSDLSEDPSATPQAETFRIVTTDTIPVVKKSDEKDSRKKNKSDRKEDDSKEKSSDRKDN
jgi:hypothetical protein